MGWFNPLILIILCCIIIHSEIKQVEKLLEPFHH